MRIMATHTIHGRNLLMSSKGIYDSVIDVAYSHHERMDGHGYPRSLPGSGISKFSRIVAIVDAYDAMTADRCYQEAKTSTEAMKIIYNERGTHFDEELTLKFIRTLGLYPAGSIVELHSGEVGIVIEANPRYRQLPKVMLMRNSQKEALEKSKVVDLSLTESGEISKEYLIKRVWKDKSFGLSVNSYLEHGLFL
jgi:HD-GYP domain-containing protein (c-di-GMP phosphodiesterase class II)